MIPQLKEIEKQIPSADRLMHGITKEQAEIIISEAEERIKNYMVILHEKETPLKEAEEFYLGFKVEYDAIKFKLDCDKLILESVSRYRNNLKSNKELRVLRASSHNDMSKREKKKSVFRFDWTSYAYQVLKEQNKFMPSDELFELVDNRFGFTQKMKDQGREKIISGTRWGAINTCWKGNIQTTKKGDKRGVLIDYKNLIGLKEWTNDDFRPNAFYIKQFLPQS